MSEALIPFALHVATGKLVEVDDVPQGMHCGCVCPGCAMPLVGRRYEDRINHFAHKTRKTFQDTKHECSYSFLVSVRAMCKQIIEETTQDLSLPEYLLTSEPISWIFTGGPAKAEISRDLYLSPLSIKIPEKTTQLSPNIVLIESQFNGTTVDVITVDQTLVIYFTYEGRGIPMCLVNMNETDVIEINLSALIGELSKKDTGVSLKERLKNLIYQSNQYKRWVSYRVSERASEQLNIKIELARKKKESDWLADNLREMERLALFQKVPKITKQDAEIDLDESADEFVRMLQNQRSSYFTENKINRYSCLNCRGFEFETSSNLPVCPKCNSHLYARLLIQKEIKKSSSTFNVSSSYYKYKDW